MKICVELTIKSVKPVSRQISGAEAATKNPFKIII